MSLCSRLQTKGSKTNSRDENMLRCWIHEDECDN